LRADKVIADGERLAGDRIYLRLLEMTDCSDRYLGWLLDPEVNRFLETRWVEQTASTVQEFVSRMRQSPADYLFAIIQSESARHVGNIKLGPINQVHRHCDVSYFIGERDVWGMGFATEAISLATRFAFERLGLHRVQAVVHQGNTGSEKALERAGFAKEGVFCRKLWTGDHWIDQTAYGILRPERHVRP